MTKITDIRNVANTDDLIGYFSGKLGWDIDVESFESKDDFSFEWTAEDLGLNEESFAKIRSLRQLRPFSDKQKWGMFCIEFDSKKFEVTAVRKVLSALIPRKRKDPNAPVWNLKDILFLCDWGEDRNRSVGLAHFEEHEKGLPQIKTISCTPSSALVDPTELKTFEERLNGLEWPKDAENWHEWSKDWSSAFKTEYRWTVRKSNELTKELAKEARNIRDRIKAIMAVENATGYVHLLWDKFKRTLVANMSAEDFADTYAQTMVYGLFSARCMDNTPEDFSIEEAIDCVPSTNPFLKNLMRSCLGVRETGNTAASRLAFDELEIDNVVELLSHTDMTEIVKDFNRTSGGGKEDPVLYFYEGFAKEYDAQKKIACGEFYTPLPVVNFIVRAVDDILKRDFGYEDGLATTATKKVKSKKAVYVKSKKSFSEKMVEEDVPAVQILDPATGTGTFLRQTILKIHENFLKKHEGVPEDALKTAWNVYVAKQLLPRLNGFELNMASYAVAHMKLAMVLKETGYDFKGSEQLHVHLTNSLEEPGSISQQLTFWDDPLAAEAIAANKVKTNNGINIVIGNPPYSVSSSNKGDWIQNLIKDYKKDLNERKINLDDDYIKFIRYAHHVVSKGERGVFAYISNNSFLDGITHRQMRKELLKTFDDIYVLNLHGNARKKETCPDGSPDENVFDIMQGVSINIFVKHSADVDSSARINFPEKRVPAVRHADLYGLREKKYLFLNGTDFAEVGWSEISLTEPYFFFVYKDLGSQESYEEGFSIREVFSVSNSGVQTKRDDLTISFDECSAHQVADDVLNLEPSSLREKYELKADGRDWTVQGAKDDLNKGFSIIKYLYRPFDYRFTAYTGRSRGFMGYPRDSVMHSMLNPNFALQTTRMQTTFAFQHILATENVSDLNSVSMQTGEQTYVFPLYLYSDELGKVKKTSNLDKKIVAAIEKVVGKTTPEDIFHYIYAVLHTPEYRDKYKEFLKIDFPHIPYPKDSSSFRALVEKGAALVATHLLKSDAVTSEVETSEVATFAGAATVDKSMLKDGCVCFGKAKAFENVPEVAWNFYIGGYQPAQKWLKDRKGRILSDDDIKHYRQIIHALLETDRLMKELSILSNSWM